MIELINWLSGVEELAVSAYKHLAETYNENEAFSSFMLKMAEDELFHVQVMEKAREFVIQYEIKNRDIIIDENTRTTIEKPLQKLLDCSRQEFKEAAEIYDLLIQVEFSEWNDIFIYVIKTLAQKGKEFESMVSVVQNHEHRIKSYFKSIKGSESWLETIEGLPKLWNHVILIAEDNEPYRELLQDILSDDYRVVAVPNGAEALREFKEHYYDIIISDVDMPEMDGLELFETLQTENSDIRERFLFMSGDLRHDKDFNELQVMYLFKPVSLEKLFKAIEDLIRLKVE